MGYWNQYSNRNSKDQASYSLSDDNDISSDDILEQDISQALRDIYHELEDITEFRPAWKKKTISLTPDLDTQSFMGDIMHGNSYLTQRIPANWNDPE
jgi:hypothetical protein